MSKVQQQTEQLNIAFRKRSRWHKAVTVMAAVVVFVTTYALILPAITWEKQLICEQEEHQHEASCYETILRPEEKLLSCQEDHEHQESCYTVVPAHEEQVLVCHIEEHVHDYHCFDAPPRESDGHICGFAEHTHTEECYFADGSLRCTLKEHTHTPLCLADPAADVETRADWEKTVAQVVLSGNWNEDLLAIAKTQLGYAESTENLINDRNEIRGYTRYGAWQGDPYGDWAAMFVSFCLNYAEIDSTLLPQESSSRQWLEKLSAEDLGLFRAAGSDYTPVPGDLVFFSFGGTETEDGLRAAGHVGIVSEVYLKDTASAEKALCIRTIEGDCGGRVTDANEYMLDSTVILGFAELPQNPHPETAPGYAWVDVSYEIVNEMARLTAVPKEHVDAADYSWQWQRSSDAVVWEDLLGATGLNFAFPATEENLAYYYRIVGSKNEEDPLLLRIEGPEESSAIAADGDETVPASSEAFSVAEAEESSAVTEEAAESTEGYSETEAETEESSETFSEAETGETAESTEEADSSAESTEGSSEAEETDSTEESSETAAEASESSEAAETETESTEESDEETDTDSVSAPVRIASRPLMLLAAAPPAEPEADPEDSFPFQEGFVPASVYSTEYTSITNTSSLKTGDMILIADKDGYYLNETVSNNRMTLTNNRNNATVWIVDIYNNQIYLKDLNGQYLSVGSGSASLSASRAAVLSYGSYSQNGRTQHAWQIAQNGQYLNDYQGGNNSVSGYGTGLSDANSRLSVTKVVYAPEYWVRCDDPSDFTTSDTYMIVYHNQSNAYTFGTSSTKSTADRASVTITEQEGTSGGKAVYLISGAAPHYSWNFSSIGSSYQLKNANITGQYLNLGNNYFTSGTNTSFTLTQPDSNAPETWRIRRASSSSNYYLRYNSSNNYFDRYNGTPESNTNMTIYRKLRVDELGSAQLAVKKRLMSTNDTVTANTAFDFCLYNGSSPVANTSYKLYDADNNQISGTYRTNSSGHFSLKDGQTALFAGLDPAQTYYAAETIRDDIVDISAAVNGADAAKESVNGAIRVVAAFTDDDTALVVFKNTPMFAENTYRDGDVYKVKYYALSTAAGAAPELIGYITVDDSITGNIPIMPGNLFKQSGISGQYVNAYYGTSSDISVNNVIGVYKSGDYLAMRSNNFAYNELTDESGTNGLYLRYVPFNESGSGSSSTKPTWYPTYVTPSGAKHAEFKYLDADAIADSDPATSDLENRFAGQQTEDGRVLTDKSVIYKDDDYDAFPSSSYAADTFGVTLSALAQKYAISEELKVEVPMDVVFILDTSSSMTRYSATRLNSSTGESRQTDQDNSGRSRDPVLTDSRIYAAVQSLNSAIQQVMTANPDNRFAVVAYNAEASVIVPLDRHELLSGSSPSYLSFQSYAIDSATISIASVLDPIPTNGRFSTGSGTYTQAGIACAGDVLAAASNTETYVHGSVDLQIPVGDGETETKTVDYDVARQPVVILITDGVPTYASSETNYGNLNYANYSGTRIGPGGETDRNGYRYRDCAYPTIRTAFAYKDTITQHYKAYNNKCAVAPTTFYTIGICYSANNTSAKAKIMRTTLNPTRDNVYAMSSTNNDDNIDGAVRAQILSSTGGSYNGEYEYVSTYNDAYGNSHPGAFFGNMSDAEMTGVMDSILSSTSSMAVYGFILRPSSPVTVTDPIGAGMKVTSEAPMLVFSYGETGTQSNGKYTYFPTSYSTKTEDGKQITTYVYNYTYVSPDTGEQYDLSQITVQKIKDANGLETMQMTVPDNVIPAYAPYLQGTRDPNNWYYEELPVRLIYQVGLTDESKAQVEYGGDYVFYTNRWDPAADSVTSAADLPELDVAQSGIHPTPGNPYYKDNAHNDADITKLSNPTGTNTGSWRVDYDSTTNDVSNFLGNNGRLEFHKPLPEIEIPVNKVWSGGKLSSVTFKLYYTTGSNTTAYPLMTPVEEGETPVHFTLTLSNSGGSTWTGKFEHIPVPEEGQTYYLYEPQMSGFTTAYSGNTAKLTIDGNEASVTMAKVEFTGTDPFTADTLTVTNTAGSQMPSTGGAGAAEALQRVGAVLLTAGLGGLVLLRRKRRREAV